MAHFPAEVVQVGDCLLSRAESALTAEGVAVGGDDRAAGGGSEHEVEVAGDVVADQRGGQRSVFAREHRQRSGVQLECVFVGVRRQPVGTVGIADTEVVKVAVAVNIRGDHDIGLRRIVTVDIGCEVPSPLLLRTVL